MPRRIYLGMALLLVILAGGYSYLRVLAHRILLETWPHREEAVRARLNEVALQPPSGPQTTVTLYFPSLDKRQLVAEKRTLALAASDADRVRQIILALIEGPRLGSDRALPPSTEVRAVFLTADGLAYVDFSNDLLTGFVPGIASETLSAYSIVNTLTVNMTRIQRVKILIQGQEVETLDGHTDLSGFLAPDPALILPAAAGAPDR